MAETRKGYKTIHEFDPDQRVVSMIEFKGNIYVASTFQVWRIEGDTLVPLYFVIEEEGIMIEKERENDN
ncbi:hypothetical protein LCGC14_0903620 [marine sediment metagenome]|uniref:Uncharacterized protein n=1 Tax=marine sediment metagenome TaxID=412755 RepID=A0A0F9S2K5_9ZZZZ